MTHQTWWLPAAKFTHPTVVQGSAAVVGCDDGWLVIAGEGKYLRVEAGFGNQ